MKLSDLVDYDYRLPPELIAQRPAVPRDSARMLVYSRKPVDGSLEFVDSVFNKLPEYLDEGYVLVCNDTKVIPARIWGKRSTGGIVEILFVEHIRQSVCKVLLSRYIKNGETLILQGGLGITVTGQEEKYFLVDTHLSYLEFISYLNVHGTMPIPPYIDNPDSRTRLRNEYQTVFAKHAGSVAAPTASLHFTNRLLGRLKKKGIVQEYVTLHVGLGTFASLTEKNFATHTLHDETYEVDATVWEHLVRAKKAGKKILAAGTTTVRVLETIARSGILTGKTDLFITPPHVFNFVDGMITNFHLPRTSLLLLVSAFIGNRSKTLELYHHAIKERYRFYSFGDGMLIL
jgi:S-adenosylmethionine:tRNA ribosyltransferase-isomerase